MDPVARGLAAKALGSLTSTGRLRIAKQRMALPPRILQRSAMATPPTVTNSTVSSQITSGFLRTTASGDGSRPLPALVSDCFTYTRGDLNPATLSLSVGFNNVTQANGPTYGPTSASLLFMHYGSAFEIVMQQNSTAFLVKIDDQYVSLTETTLGASGTIWYKYDFGGVSARRKVEVIGWNPTFIGVVIGPNDSIEKASARGPRTILVGDSFIGAQGPANACLFFGDALGWDDVWASGVAGTGYVNTNGGAKPNFVDRVLHDVIGYAPEVVGIIGSVNDDATTPSVVGAAATSLYSQIRSALPGALVFASPTASGGANKWTNNKLQVHAAMKAAADATGVVWCSLVESTLYGTALSGTTTQGYSAGNTAMRFNFVPLSGGTYEIGTGATAERIQCKSFSQASVGNYNVFFDGALQFAHSSGDAVRQVGGSLWTGTGKVGATTGWGTSDIFVQNDGTHPTYTVGQQAIGESLAQLLLSALRPNG